MGALIPVAEAADALLLQMVARLEQHGPRVSWQRLTEFDTRSESVQTYAAYLAFNDDEKEFLLWLRYEGGRDDRVPEAFRDFATIVDNQETGIDALLEGSSPDGRSRRELHTDDGLPLKFLARLPFVAEPDEFPVRDWLPQSGGYLRCCRCDWVVAVEDPDGECPCGGVFHGEDGEPMLDESGLAVAYRLDQDQSVSGR